MKLSVKKDVLLFKIVKDWTQIKKARKLYRSSWDQEHDTEINISLLVAKMMGTEKSHVIDLEKSKSKKKKSILKKKKKTWALHYFNHPRTLSPQKALEMCGFSPKEPHCFSPVRLYFSNLVKWQL